MKKKLLFAAVIAFALAALISVFAFTSSAATEWYYTYTVKDGKATITDVDSAISGDIVIPSTLGGYPVTSIGSYAFYWCDRLTSIEMPASVTSIGDEAFSSCDSLTSIEMPASVTSIGSYAFAGCNSLTSITVAEGNLTYHSAGNCLIETESKTLIAGCKNSVIPTDGSVTSIGSYAFYFCDSLTSIEIPASVTSIGSDAFYYCTSLALVTIEPPAIAEGVTSSSSYGYLCSYAKTVVIPTTVTSIGSYIAENFTNVDRITQNGSVMTVYSDHSHAETSGSFVDNICTSCALEVDAFPCEFCHLAEGATCTTPSVCEYCDQLLADALGHDLLDATCTEPIRCTRCPYTTGDALGHDMLNTDCTTPATCDRCGHTEGDALGHDMADATCLLPATCTRCGHTEGDALGHGYHAWHTTLAPTYITDGVETSVCANDPSHILTRTLVHPDLVAEWSCGTGVTARLFPDTAKAGKYTLHVFGTGEMSDYTASSMPWHSYLDAITALTVYDGVTVIGDYAFRGCTALASVFLPVSITEIGTSAFRNCASLATLSSLDSLVTVGNYAFYGCSALTSLVFGEYATLDGVGTYSFSGCDSLLWVSIRNASMAAKFTDYNACGYLFTVAKTVAFEQSITAIPAYVSQHYSYINALDFPDSTYNVYSFHSHSASSSVWKQEGSLTACTECDIRKLTSIKIASAYLNLSDNVNLFYTVIVPDGYENPYMVFELNGKTYTVTESIVRADGKIAFCLGAIRPQYFGDSIRATVYATYEGELQSDVKESYSVRSYCQNQLKRGTSDENLVRVVSDLLAYGDATQKYLGYKTDSLSSATVSYTPSVFVAPLNTQKTLAGEKDERITWKSAGVRLENTLAIYVRFKATVAPENASIRFNIAGKSVVAELSCFTPDEEGYYTIYVRGIAATEFDYIFSATFLVDGKAVGQVLKYSVSSYVYANDSHADSALAELVRALYNYGRSSRVYAGYSDPALPPSGGNSGPLLDGGSDESGDDLNWDLL